MGQNPQRPPNHFCKKLARICFRPTQNVSVSSMKKIISLIRPLISFCLAIVLTINFTIATRVEGMAAPTKKIGNKPLQDLTKNVNLIYPLVLQRTKDAVSSAKKVTPKLTIITGPDSKIYSKNIDKAFNVTMQVFNKNELPPKAIILVTTGNDENWAKERYLELMGDRADLNYIGYGHSPNGSAVQIKRIDPSNEALLRDPNVPSGATDAHGFTHLLQWYQLGFGNINHLGIPRWILEGSADFMQGYYMNRENLNNWISNMNAKNLKKHKLKFLNSYLEYEYIKEVPGGESSWQITNQYPDEWAYEIGYFVCLVLVALKGPNSLIQIYRDFVETEDFDRTFENIYGMPWSEAKPHVAQILYKLARK